MALDLKKSHNDVVLRGTILAVYEPVEVGENKLRKQVIMFEKPPFVDGFGETKGKPEVWELSALGDVIDRLKITVATHEGQKATVGFYVSSNEIDSKKLNEKGKEVVTKLRIINAQLVECELYLPATRA